MKMKNINHRNYFLGKEPIVIEKEQPKIVAKPEISIKTKVIVVESDKNSDDNYTEDMLYGLNKDEQISLLVGLGLSKTKINKLKYEKDRVKKILELII